MVRRAVAEALGTAFLLAAIIGSGSCGDSTLPLACAVTPEDAERVVLPHAPQPD